MATLFNTKISQTYPGLFKTIDNAVLTAAFKELTDGSGNQSGLFLNTAGDFKVTAILEWGSLKDTGTGVTITRFVTSTDGIENFNNNTTLPTSAAVKLYVDTKFAITDTLTEVLGFGNTTSGKDIAISAGDDITFTDTSKAIFGLGSDLSIFHDGANSFIQDLGTGNLKIQTNGLGIDLTKGSTEFLAKFIIDGGNELYFNNVKKFETTTDGSKVTGNLVVTGTITGSGGGSFLPLAGGLMTGNTIHNDNVKSIYGTLGDGLEIFHDGTHSYLEDTGTGDLRIKTNGASIALLAPSNEDMVLAVPNSFVKLYFNNSEKLATNVSGVNVTGNLSTTANVNVGANATFVDNGKALFGNSNDLSIFHDGSNSYIQEAGTGNLYLKATSLILSNSAGSNYLIGNSGDSVNIYFNGSEKFRTLTDGAKVTGNLVVTGNITANGGGSFLRLDGGTMTGNTIHNDNVKSIYGTGSDLEIFHSGTDSFIQNTGGDLKVSSTNIRFLKTGLGEFIANFFADGANEFFFNGSKKLETTNTGISVTGNGIFSANLSIPDSAYLYAGTGLDLSLTHNGTDSFIGNATGQLNIDQAAVTQSIVFKTSNNFALDTTALTISRNGDMLTGRNVTIAGDLTVNGTTTTVNSQTLAVVDPLIQLAKSNTANSLDIGFYGDYNDGTGRFLGLFNDASDSNKFKLFKGLTVEPTTTVNIGGTGYESADLVVAGLEGASVVSTGSVIAASGNSGQITLSANAIGSTNNLVLSTGGGGANIEMYNTEMYFDSNTHFFRSANAGTTYLTINSTSASFAGAVSAVGNLTAARGFFNAGATNVVATFTSTDATSTLQCIDSGGNVEFGASGNNFVVQPAGGVAQLTVGASTSTFAGTIIYNGALRSTTPTEKLILSNSSTTTELHSAGSGGTVFKNSGNNAILTLDSSNNATFAADVTTGGRIRVASGTDQGSQLCLFADGNGATSLAGFTFSINTGGNNSRTQAVLIDQSKNATFAGNVTTGQSLTVNGVGNNSSLTLGANTGNWVFTNVQASRNLEISDSDGTGVALTIDTNTNATFAGDIQTNGYLTLTGQATPQIFMDSTTAGTPIWTLISRNDGYFIIGRTGVANDFSIDPSGNAIFEGKIASVKELVNIKSANGLRSAGLESDSVGDIWLGTGTTAATINFVTGNSTNGLPSTNGVKRLTTNREGTDVYASYASNTFPFRVGFVNGSTYTPTFVINDNGRVGIGTNAPTRLLQLTDGEVFMRFNPTTVAGDYRFHAADGKFYIVPEDTGVPTITLTSGNIGFGTTSDDVTNGAIFIKNPNTTNTVIKAGHKTGSVNGADYLACYFNNVQIGGVAQATTSSVSFNTSSDYRLKEDLQDFAGLDMVSKIPVYNFKWKSDEGRSYGVMAHELQEVLPQAVSGQKDADEMQSVDYSKIVPLLVKSIQELTAKVERLEAK